MPSPPSALTDLPTLKVSTRLSVVIPAYNSATTIAQTLESLQAQTVPDWEAIVVNDGSTDETASIINQFAQQDARIRLINLPHQGVCTARNEGIRLTQADWLLFLDADDWIAATYMEKMLGKLADYPDSDVIHCSSVRVAADGTFYGEKHVPLAADLFPELARYCPFSINACIVRKSLVLALDGFDSFFFNNQDWDLWQRIARTGAQFVAVPEVLAFYRMRHNSHSSDSIKRFTYGLRTLIQGHGPDPRVPNPHPAHANGMPAEQLPSLKFLLATWCAGTLLGVGKDARHILDLFEDEPVPALDPHTIAVCLLESLPVPTTLSPTILWKQWHEMEPWVDTFLAAMEAKSQAPLLADRVRVILDRLILQEAEAPFPLSLGKTCALCIDITEALVDLYFPAAVERAYCMIEAAGSPVGTLELPVCDGMLSAVVLADAIAANFSWKILGHFFEQTLYPTLTTADNFQAFHDENGWLLFLQQLWDRPGWSNADFYNPKTEDASPFYERIEHPELTLEVSESLPTLPVNAPEINVLVTVGGAALGYVSVPVQDGRVTAQALRVALLLNAGTELCWAVVREGLLGRPLADPTNLRQRLSEAAQQQPKNASMGKHFALNDSSDQVNGRLILGRRSPATGTSDSRWAMLPAATATVLMEAAIATQEPIVQMPTAGVCPRQVVYAPSWVASPLPSPSDACPGSHPKQPWIRHLWKNTITAVKHQSQQLIDRSFGLKKPSPEQHQPLHQDAGDPILTRQLAILKYPPIASVAPAQSPIRQVTTQALEGQLAYLREAGYYSVSLETWRRAVANRQPLPGRGVLLTFDDESLAFYTETFPLLQKYGFLATVFVVVDRIDQPGLMNWQQLRQLQAEGIEVGSHSLSHRPLTGLSITEVVQEAARSRAVLSQELGKPVRSFAYPHGDYDAVVQHLIGACGYTFGFTHCSEPVHFQHPFLALPRIDMQNATLENVIARLP